MLRSYSGTLFFDRGSLFNGNPADLIAAAQRAIGPGWQGSDVGWNPAQMYAYTAMNAASVASEVLARAGAGR